MVLGAGNRERRHELTERCQRSIREGRRPRVRRDPAHPGSADDRWVVDFTRPAPRGQELPPVPPRWVPIRHHSRRRHADADCRRRCNWRRPPPGPQARRHWSKTFLSGGPRPRSGTVDGPAGCPGQPMEGPGGPCGGRSLLGEPRGRLDPSDEPGRAFRCRVNLGKLPGAVPASPHGGGRPRMEPKR
jgi:hypothetical protein